MKPNRLFRFRRIEPAPTTLSTTPVKSFPCMVSTIATIAAADKKTQELHELFMLFFLFSLFFQTLVS